MTSIEALRLLDALSPAFTTNDAAACLGRPPGQVSVTLKRLADAGHLVRLCRGRWAFPARLHAFAVPESLTAPTPSYVSFHSALHHHGLIEQVPVVVYAATLGPSRRVRTPIATISFHSLAPHFFFGFDTDGRLGAKVAVPEKALVDYLYLGPARSRRFRALPELEFSRGFSFSRARKMAARIRSAARRTWVIEKLAALQSISSGSGQS